MTRPGSHSKLEGRSDPMGLTAVWDEETAKEKEGERLEKYKKGNAYLCALAIEGKKMDSLEFSKWIEQLGINGISHLVFVIGGSLGLDKKILESSEEKISFSKMTFPHQLMRIILLEQVYRAYRIINKEPYHK